MIYGYARISADGQSLDAQVKQLRAARAEKVFRETASGAKTDRVQLRRALDQLAKGDVLWITGAVIGRRAGRLFRAMSGRIIEPPRSASFSDFRAGICTLETRPHSCRRGPI
jgi:DNA invertase Pin-like site-specific DNA recombinase